MRVKRGVKETNINYNDIRSTVQRVEPILNGLHKAKSGLLTETTTNIEKAWTADDYQQYFMRRINESATEHNFKSTDLSLHRCDDMMSHATSSNNTSDESSDTSPGYVFRFYRRIAGPFYWNKCPKTDYTYSPSSKFYKKEITPGIPIVPNLSRRPCRLAYTFQTGNARSILPPKYLEDSGDLSSNGTPKSRYSFVRRRNAKIFRENHWHRYDWIKESFEYIKTIVITTITKTVTTTVETVMHPTRKPYITFPLIFLLLALLLYLLLITNDDVEEGSKKLIPSFPLGWIENQTVDTSTFINFCTVVTKPFLWAVKLALTTMQLILTCLFMIPTLFSQLAQSIYTFLCIVMQRITGYTNDSPIINGALDDASAIVKFTDKSSIINSEEIRRVVTDILSEKKFVENREDINREIRSANEEVETLKEFIIKVNKKLASLERVHQDQKKTLDEILPQLKVLEEKLSVTQLKLGQSAEIASTGGANVNVTSIVGWSEVSENVAHLVKNILKQYHADRTGMPDYALMSNGGTIISIGCTQTYTKDSGKIYVLGFPVWNVHSNPDVIIKPGIMPGECWAFEGSLGSVTIGLAMPIYVTGFTMEHTPKELTPLRNIKSAPYQFSVWALEEILDKTPQFLGRFKFLDNGESLQYFDALKLAVPVKIVQLRIESNHGSINFTCLYRFRVHGVPA